MEEYKKCFVPYCNNNSSDTPHKIIVRIREDLRREWCRAANVEYFNVYTQYCCEDHFDPKEDLKNYSSLRRYNEKPALKPTAKLRDLRILSIHSEETSLELFPLQTPSELCKILTEPQPSTSKKRKHETSVTTSSMSEDLLQIPFKVSVHAQCSAKMVDKTTQYRVRKMQFPSPPKPSTPGTTSPFVSSSPSLYDGFLNTDIESSDHKSTGKLTSQTPFVNLIESKPKMYLGLPENHLWLIGRIIEKSVVAVSRVCLILTLFKIKQNDTIERMSDQFEMPRSVISGLIFEGIQVLCTYLQNFIFVPSIKQVKVNLPLAFKIRYSNVHTILDCFEIQTSKPSNPQTQAQSWSQYKGCNTIKFLIGCSPNGYVSFISKGYGGRISDKAIVQVSNFISTLPANSVVMADRGFKEIESLLVPNNIALLRPPSVFAGIKLTKAQVLAGKVIASLRVHVERVIRRLREFALLKPHSVVHYKYISYLDEILVIACGLINLQNEIIRKQ